MLPRFAQCALHMTGTGSLDDPNCLTLLFGAFVPICPVQASLTCTLLRKHV